MFARHHRGGDAASINGQWHDDSDDVDSDDFDQHSELLGETVRQHLHSTKTY